jgi:hypothetical protein
VSEVWLEQNQRGLAAALASVRQALARHAGLPAPGPGEDAPPAAAALETLCATFGLSPFERDVVLLAAGPELDGGFGALCAAAHGDPQRSHPTFGLALAALADPHWSAALPSGPLRRWQLVEIAPGPSLTAARLHLDEHVLHYLLGIAELDPRLGALTTGVRALEVLPPSRAALAAAAAAHVREERLRGAWPLIELLGEEPAAAQAVAAAVCADARLSLRMLPAETVPDTPADTQALARLWEREAALAGRALLIDCTDGEQGTARRAARLADELRCVVLVAARTPLPRLERAAFRLEVGRPTAAERSALWRDALGQLAEGLNGGLPQLAAQFELESAAIRAAGAEAAAAAPDTDLAGRLWDACRRRARPRLDDLARRIEPVAGWDDLVLPGEQLATLREIAAQVRGRARVYDDWGFAARGPRGLGVSALFTGPSGTGKTMAAEVLARELRLDLYQIDLSAVVSKYIGETEKNLRRVFDAAEAGAAILLFDEADALFGKRSEVKDSHDRYANIEVGYLLQRMEGYRGLAVLTTNHRAALDPSFLRRIRFVVHFPFPDAGQRQEIWRRIFPDETPTDALEVATLARLNVAGGSIRNIALAAAFLAADEEAPVQMGHLRRAARSEYAKLERPLTAQELEGWGS